MDAVTKPAGLYRLSAEAATALVRNAALADPDAPKDLMPKGPIREPRGYPKDLGIAYADALGHLTDHSQQATAYRNEARFRDGGCNREAFPALAKAAELSDLGFKQEDPQRTPARLLAAAGLLETTANLYAALQKVVAAEVDLRPAGKGRAAGDDPAFYGEALPGTAAFAFYAEWPAPAAFGNMREALIEALRHADHAHIAASKAVAAMPFSAPPAPDPAFFLADEE